MKALLLKLLLLLLPAILSAQNFPTDKLFDQYKNKDGFSSFVISEMIIEGLLRTAEKGSAEKIEKEFGKIKCIKILSYSNADIKANKSNNLYNELIKSLTKGGYECLLEVSENAEDYTFMALKKGERINELLIVGRKAGEAGFVSIRGDFDIDGILKLTENLKIDGLEGLKKLKEKHEKDVKFEKIMGGVIIDINNTIC